MTASPLVLRSVSDRLRAAGCVFAEEEARLLVAEASSPSELDDMVARRVTGHPLEQVLGWAGFRGLRIAVEPGVFVPRRRTELLVHEAAALVGPATRSGPATVVDLCCGSGAVGVALLAALDRVDLHAVDIDPAAVACARRNIGDDGRAYEGDLYEPLPAHLRGRVDVVVANAPYVPTDEIGTMPAEARVHERRIALDGGTDGLDVQRRVVAGAADWLAADGHVLVETSDRQAPHTVEAFTRDGFVTRVVRRESTGATVVVGTRPHRRRT